MLSEQVLKEQCILGRASGVNCRERAVLDLTGLLERDEPFHVKGYSVKKGCVAEMGDKEVPVCDYSQIRFAHIIV